MGTPVDVLVFLLFWRDEVFSLMDLFVQYPVMLCLFIYFLFLQDCEGFRSFRL